MERQAFALKAFEGKADAAREKLRQLAPEIRKSVQKWGVDNFSMWAVADMIYGYGEWVGDFRFSMEMLAPWQAAMKDLVEMICPPDTMELMYHDYGVVRGDKSLIRHRVFSTRLKPGCAEEYKRRHAALIEKRGTEISEGPDSNFSIWHGKGYIFGYCEKVRAFDGPMTDDEKAATIEWETHQLEIMDWLTDDVDWITGEKHEAIVKIV